MSDDREGRGTIYRLMDALSNVKWKKDNFFTPGISTRFWDDAKFEDMYNPLKSDFWRNATIDNPTLNYVPMKIGEYIDFSGAYFGFEFAVKNMWSGFVAPTIRQNVANPFAPKDPYEALASLSGGVVGGMLTGGNPVGITIGGILGASLYNRGLVEDDFFTPGWTQLPKGGLDDVWNYVMGDEDTDSWVRRNLLDRDPDNYFTDKVFELREDHPEVKFQKQSGLGEEKTTGSITGREIVNIDQYLTYKGYDS